MVTGIGGEVSRSGGSAGGSAEAAGEGKAGVQEVDANVQTILKQLHGNLQGRRLGGGTQFTCVTST